MTSSLATFQMHHQLTENSVNSDLSDEPNDMLMVQTEKAGYGQTPKVTYLDIGRVRIQPPKVIFINPFEGKSFSAVIHIMNCGAQPAVIRILSPTSSALQIRLILQGRFLSCGMQIKRTIRYKVQMMTLVESCTIPIYINDTLVRYKVKLNVASIHGPLAGPLVVQPSNEIDLGFVDASSSTAKRVIQLVNVDVNPARFTVDINNVTIDMTVEPVRGVVLANESLDLRISAILPTAGSFSTEFWVICDNPICIRVFVQVGYACLTPLFTYDMKAFTFIRFPVTYRGMRVRRQLVVQNNSQTAAYFCVMVENGMEKLTPLEAAEANDDYKLFHISPPEGCMLPNDTRVFTFTFTAPKVRTQEQMKKKKNTYLLMLCLQRLDCKDYNAEDYVISSEPMLPMLNKSMNSLIYDTSMTITEGGTDDESLMKLKILQEYPKQIRIMLYSQLEEANVSVMPTAITLLDIKLNETISRVINITNNSTLLPIYFHYRKMLFIDIEPSFGCLQSLESKDLAVFIVSRNYDNIKSSIIFDLLHYNNPRINDEFTVLCQIKVDIEITTKIESHPVVSKTELLQANKFTFHSPLPRPKPEIMKKHIADGAYLALPDHQLWPIGRNTKGRKFHSIYTAISRYESSFRQFALSPRDKELLEKKNYYDQYIRTKHRPSKPATTEHSTSTCTRTAVDCLAAKVRGLGWNNMETREFVPLSPSQLALINVTPMSFVVENVAYDSTYIHRMIISNGNINFILAYIRPKRNNILDLGDNARMTIAPNEKQEVEITLLIGQVPLCVYEVDVILNNSFVIETSVIVKALPRHLRLGENQLIFADNEKPSKFIELHNDLNINIPFKWYVPSLFTVDPPEGEVLNGRFVACMISYKTGTNDLLIYELGIVTENQNYILKVIIETTDYRVKLPKVLAFGDQSVNVTCHKLLPLTNCSQLELPFMVMSPLPEDYYVQPHQGILKPYGTVNIRVSTNCIRVGEISAKITILVADNKRVSCDITGSIAIPRLQFRPDIIRFKKMSASSFDIVCVTAINTSNAIATISFDTVRLPELNYSEFTNSAFYTNDDRLIINPNEEKTFAIHFYPFNPIITSSTLPMSINKCVYSQQQKTSITSKPTVKIHAQVVAYKLEVSTWRYSFQYFPHFGYNCTTLHKVRISNPARNPVQFCIRLDDLAEPFKFDYLSGGNLITFECSYVVDLLPNEEINFQATFQPKTPGTYSTRLPVFVRDDYNEDVHNYFYFTGVYPPATFSYLGGSIHLGFVPLNFTVMKKITIDMSYHNPECACAAFVNDPHCSVELDSIKLRKLSYTKSIIINFRHSKPYLLRAKFIMECDCAGSNLELEVFGGCENCIYTVHACFEYFRLSRDGSFNEFFACEPQPVTTSGLTVPDDKDDEAKHSFKVDLPFFQSGKEPFDLYMNKVVDIVEQWLLEQVYSGTHYMSIPDNICLPDVKTYEKQGRREGIIKVPLQTIMLYLLGQGNAGNFEIKYTDKKPLWMILKKYYQDVLNCLLALDCFVNQIRSENLLPYDHYKESMISTERRGNMLTCNAFYLLSKQSWLDLLLQCYKTFVMVRISQLSLSATFPSRSSMFRNSSIGSMQLTQGPRASPIASPNVVYGSESTMIVAWLNKHFVDHKTMLASEKYGNKMTPEFARKKIVEIDVDFNDGLALISVLLAYCPFFSEYIVGIYAPANNRLERFNNAYLAIKLLTLLNVSFHLEPIDIVEPVTLKTFMFLTYLYEFLMSLKYKETLVFEAHLTKKCSEQILITNDGRQKLNYSVIFFNNTDNLFSVSDTAITVEIGAPVHLAINFVARFLRVQKTVMLLSGEIPGGTYTNSRMFYLEGKPQLDESGIDIEAKTVIYKIMKTTFNIQSPYYVAADYEVYFAEDLASQVNDMVKSLISFQSIIETNTLVCVKPESGRVRSDDKGVIELNVQLCNIIALKRTCRLVFRNKNVGDFIVSMLMTTSPIKRQKAIDLHIQKTLIKYPCICPKKRPDVTNLKCPRNSKVMVPCRNEFLWESVMAFFLSGRNPDEAEFWNEYKQTPIGSHIVQRILCDQKKFLSSDMSYVMQNTFKYKVTSAKNNNNVVVQPFKEITAGLDEETEILVHVNQPINSFGIKMVSVDDKEVRNYLVNIKYKM